MARAQRKIRAAAQRKNVPAPVTPPSNESLVRLFSRLSSETDDVWAIRRPTNKAMCAVDGISVRLGGLSQFCWSMSLLEIYQGSNRGLNAQHNPYGYLARALEEMAKALHQAHDLWWNEPAKGR